MGQRLIILDLDGTCYPSDSALTRIIDTRTTEFLTWHAGLTPRQLTEMEERTPSILEALALLGLPRQQWASTTYRAIPYRQLLRPDPRLIRALSRVAARPSSSDHGPGTACDRRPRNARAHRCGRRRSLGVRNWLYGQASYLPEPGRDVRRVHDNCARGQRGPRSRTGCRAGMRVRAHPPPTPPRTVPRLSRSASGSIDTAISSVLQQHSLYRVSMVLRLATFPRSSRSPILRV